MPAYNPKATGNTKVDPTVFDIYRILNWIQSAVDKINNKVVIIEDTGVSPGTLDHTLLNNLDSSGYSHLTAANKTDLTDGGVTSLHSHADGHDPATVLDTTTVDMSISGQEISAVTIGLTGTITFVE